MQSLKHLLFVVLLVIGGCNSSQYPDSAEIKKLAIQDSMVPIRPGNPPGTSFWNVNAQRFIYVPSFNFNKIENAETYEFTALAADSNTYSFKANTPWALLSPIWQDLPVGTIHLKVTAFDHNGNSLGIAGERSFYRAAVYKGGYHEPSITYKESATKALDFIYNQTYIQNWKTTGLPDTAGYDLYTYPAKIIGSVVSGMSLYASLVPEHSKDALLIAEKAADYLIDISEPASSALAYFPPTYRWDYHTSKEYKGQFMLIYPAEAAMDYLDLYDMNQNKKYLDAALRIADTLVKLQLPEGTWNLKMLANGKPVTPNFCIPVDMIQFFDRLERQYGVDKYRGSLERAFNWIMENPVKTFNWEGQFEDVPPSQLYKNLSKHLPCSFAIYLMDRDPENPEYLKIAREITRFAEDQFVVWEKPMPQTRYNTRPVEVWHTPCALEQYHYYVPIDASVAKLLITFQKMYEVTKEPLYLEKAKSMANSIIAFQNADTGQYPTYLEYTYRRSETGWLNCAMVTGRSMMGLYALLNN